MAQVILDILQLHAITVKLDTGISSAEELDIAFRRPAAQIAGFVQASIGWMINEAFSSQRFSLPISLSNAEPTDMYFSGYAERTSTPHSSSTHIC